MRLPGIAWSLLGVVALLAARRWLDVVEVRGRSMAPTLLPGDRLLVVRAPPRVGDVVLVSDPRSWRRELIKRVAALDAGAAWLSGDNPAWSTDARTFGAIPRSAIGWRALVRYWPPSRIGVLGGRPARVTGLDEGGEPACAFPDALVGG
jgi:nickel-type superoxide dismutase maturation protease